jgi:hypothetical protein
MCIASTIIMKGLMTSCASFFEVLQDFYLAYVCEFQSMILHMRLTDFLAHVGPRPSFGETLVNLGPLLDFNTLVEEGAPRRS